MKKIFFIVSLVLLACTASLPLSAKVRLPRFLSVINVKQAYRDLMDSLDYITGNIALNKTKSGVKTGLYYSNDLLDNDLPDLKGLTRYLHSRKVEPYNKLKGYEVLKSRIESKIKKIDLAKRWNERKFNRFSLEQIERMESWL